MRIQSVNSAAAAVAMLQVTTLENGIRILQEEVMARRGRWVLGGGPNAALAVPRCVLALCVLCGVHAKGLHGSAADEQL